ncbi:MAG: hypothetical protein ACI4VH_06725 [Clostridia bacterium]
MKTIEICGKKYPIDCNAFTRFQYKTVFGKGVFADIKVLNNFSEKQEELKKTLKSKGKSEKEIEKEISLMMMENLDDFIDVIERIAYILIYTADSKIGSFEDWLKEITKIDLSSDWISEVTELAVNSFC